MSETKEYAEMCEDCKKAAVYIDKLIKELQNE